MSWVQFTAHNNVFSLSLFIIYMENRFKMLFVYLFGFFSRYFPFVALFAIEKFVKYQENERKKNQRGNNVKKQQQQQKNKH